MGVIIDFNTVDFSSLHVGCGLAPCLFITLRRRLLHRWTASCPIRCTLLSPYSSLQPFPIRSRRLLCGSWRWTVLHLMVESPTLVAPPHQTLVLKAHTYLVTLRVSNPPSSLNLFLHCVPQTFTDLPASLFVHQVERRSPHLDPYREN